jgi:cysteine-rich repeat protein
MILTWACFAVHSCLQALKYAAGLASAGTLALILSVHFAFEKAAWCGNRVLEPHEACDRGTDASVAGCTANCSIMPGFQCRVNGPSGFVYLLFVMYYCYENVN